MGIKSSAFHRSELPAFSLLTVHRESWMRLTKAFCWTPLGRIPRQQLAGSEVTLTTFIPSRPLAPNTGCQSHRLPAFPLIPRDMSDLSTCFCSIKAISHLANGTEEKERSRTECSCKKEQERKWERWMNGVRRVKDNNGIVDLFTEDTRTWSCTPDETPGATAQ